MTNWFRASDAEMEAVIKGELGFKSPPTFNPMFIKELARRYLARGEEIRQLRSALKGVPRDLINWMPPEERNVLCAKIEGHAAAMRDAMKACSCCTTNNILRTALGEKDAHSASAKQDAVFKAICEDEFRKRDEAAAAEFDRTRKSGEGEWGGGKNR